MTFTWIAIFIAIISIISSMTCSKRHRKELLICKKKYNQTNKILLKKINEYETLINALPGYVWQKDNFGKIVIANKETCLSLKTSTEEIIGKSVYDLFPKLIAEKFEQQDNQLLSGKIAFIQSEDISPIDDEKKIISTRMVAVKDNDNEITGIIGIGIDITKTKILEEKLRYRESYSKIITEIAINFINIPLPEIDNAIIKALAVTGEFSMADRAFLVSYDFDTRTISCSHEWLSPDGGQSTQMLTNMPFDRFHQWIETCLSNGQIFIPNAQKLSEDDPLRQILDEQPVKSLIVSPLRNGARCLGFVGLTFIQSEKKTFENEVELLKLMSELLTNAKLRQEHYLHLAQAKAKADTAYKNVEARVQKRTQELDTANKLLKIESEEKTAALSNLKIIQSAISLVLIAVNSNGIIFRWGETAELAFGIKSQDANGTLFKDIDISWDWKTVMNRVQTCTTSCRKTQPVNVRYRRTDGSDGFLLLTVNPLPGNEAPGYLILGEDVTDIRILESKLAQSAKLEAIGQLAAGIAHEINTPAQYVSDSVEFLKDFFDDTTMLVDLLKVHCREGIASERIPAPMLCSILSNLDLELYTTEIPGTFDRISDGMKRIANIVHAMNRFSHNSCGIQSEVNVNEVIGNIITISRHEWKYIAELETELDPNLKSIIGNGNEIGQVILNIIINATHAISESIRNKSRRGIILVTSRNVEDGIKVTIQDNGIGIPKDIHDKIFNLFFTTKTLDKGTGQGLAIAYDIVVHKHRGCISFTSEPERKTIFEIFFPLNSDINDQGQEGAHEPKHSVRRR